MNKPDIHEIRSLQTSFHKSRRARSISFIFGCLAIIAYVACMILGNIYPESMYSKYIELAKTFLLAGAFVLLICYVSYDTEAREKKKKLNKFTTVETLRNLSFTPEFTAEEALKANETDIILVSKKADMLYNDIINQIKEAAPSNTKLLLVGWSVRQYDRGHQIVDIADSNLLRSEIDSVVNALLESNFSLLISDAKIKKDWTYKREVTYKKVEISWGAEYYSGVITPLTL